MSLNRFVVTNPFFAWSPGDRNLPERRVSISPGSKHLFTDERESQPVGSFIKFLKGGCWYEADRWDFIQSTAPLCGKPQEPAISVQRGA